MQHLRSPSSLCRTRTPQIWSLRARISTPERGRGRGFFDSEMKTNNSSVRVAFNQAPTPPAEAVAALLVSALAKSQLVAVDQFGLLMGGNPINKGDHNTHVDPPEPFDVDGNGELNGGSGDAPTEKLPSKDETAGDEPKKEQGEADENGEGEDSDDQDDDGDQDDAPDGGGDDYGDDDDDDAEDGGEDDEDEDDDEDDNDGPDAEEEVDGGEDEEGFGDEDEDEEELQPPKKRKK